MFKVYDNESYRLETKDYTYESLAKAIEIAQWLRLEMESHGDSFHYFRVRDLETGRDVYFG